MSDTRALRDKLEKTQAELQRVRTHLERLRAYHARERESLEQQLEAAQREAARLRTQVAVLERFTREVQPPADSVPQPPRLELPPEASHVLVAVARLPRSPEEALPVLSRLTGQSPADVRLRLSAPLPALVRRLPAGEAWALRDALRAEGFGVVTHELARGSLGALPVRRFALGEHAARLEGLRGESLEVAWSDMRLLVRGRRIVAARRPQEEQDFDEEGKPVLRRPELKVDPKEPFLWLYGEGFQAAFGKETDFGGLGARRGLARAASLQALGEELERRAPHLVLDDQLVRLPGLVLPFVPPERSLELFGELLWQAVRSGLR